MNCLKYVMLLNGQHDALLHMIYIFISLNGITWETKTLAVNFLPYLQAFNELKWMIITFNTQH